MKSDMIHASRSNRPEVSTAAARHRPSPALILFLVFPLLGLIAAGVVIATSGGTPGGALADAGAGHAAAA